MRFKILGSGGAMPTPRAFCQCKICRLARKNSKYKRNSSSAFIQEINALIDCPEDIGDSLNRENIRKVDRLFITHWHPDHTFGLRVLLEANYNFLERKPTNIIEIFISKTVYNTLKERFPAIIYLIDVIKVAKIHFVDDEDQIKFGKISVQVIGYNGKNSNYYAYLFEENNKRLLYAPCDTLHFKNYSNFKNIDVLVHECGIFSYDKVKTELSFPDMIQRFKEIIPVKTYLTHIEEVELNVWGLDYIGKMVKGYKRLSLAYDGLTIEL
ncbi:MBL fold metallo-hydrolase [Candidatus Woesearchaeota archaeon]|nr:hypothetical protein [uncultured archaeon]MBS3108143.1 MBL fold metallo-hydrolase [Candidatus Woesearchaeota archaeon]